VYAEILGYIAVFFSVFAFSASDKIKMRSYGSVSLFFFMISVFLNGGLNGALVSLLSLIVRVLSIFVKEDKLQFLKYLSPFFALAFYLYIKEDGFQNILPLIALVVVIVADLQENIIKMKTLYVLNVSIWLVYAIYLSSYSAILYESLGIFVLLLSLYKLKGKHHGT
jgi:hypothetical protein